MSLFSGSVSSIIKSVLSIAGIGGSIGSFGDVVFSVSTAKVLTFNDYKRATKARLSSHDVIGQKPVIEFLGADGEEISISIDLLASLGVNPATQADKLRTMCQNGETAFFMLGNECIGSNKWLISDVSESATEIDDNGRILVSHLDLTLKEYVETLTTITT